ncbi:hypothetical protein ACLK1T_19540 [Escherichia coli]
MAVLLRRGCCRSVCCCTLPLEPANTTVSQPMITLLLIACPLLPFIIMAICKGDRLPSRSAARPGCAATTTKNQW